MQLTMFDAFKLIAAKVKDPYLQREALKSLGFTGPTSQLRLRWLLPHVLADGEFSQEEQQGLINLLEPTPQEVAELTWQEEPRTSTIHVRVTEVERAQLDQWAKEAGLSLSEYIRKQLFLPQGTNKVSQQDCKRHLSDQDIKSKNR